MLELDGLENRHRISGKTVSGIRVEVRDLCQSQECKVPLAPSPSNQLERPRKISQTWKQLLQQGGA